LATASNSLATAKISHLGDVLLPAEVLRSVFVYTRQESVNPEDDKYLQEAREVFARMSPEGRVRFGRYLGEKAQQQGHTFIDLNQDGIDDRLQDPAFLAHKTNQIRHEQPSLLSQIFGRHRRGYGRRVGGYDGAYLSGSFEAEDRSECGETAGGILEDFFGGDSSDGGSFDGDSSGGD
jgi:hypothetical protein